LFNHGPGLDWIGQSRSEISEKSIAATIICPIVNDLQSVDPTLDYIPTRLSGSIETATTMPLEELVVVASVNGVAQGVTKPFQAEDGLQFELILSDQLFNETGNEVELFLMPLPL